MSRKYLIHENFFNIIDTEYKAYILGYLYADGYVNNKNNYFELTLKNIDLQILEDIKHHIFIDKNRPILPIKGGRYYRLSVSSKKMVYDLIKLGCVQKKTFLLEFPEIKNNLLRHFIRGYFDGDGSVYLINKTLNISIVGTINLLLTIQSILIKELEFNKTEFDNRHPDRNTNIRSLRYGGNIIMNRFYHYLYDNSNIFLKRKKNIFEKILISKNYYNNKKYSRTTHKKEYHFKNIIWTNTSELSRELSKKTGILATTIRRKLNNNWTIDEIITIPLNKHRKRDK